MSYRRIETLKQEHGKAQMVFCAIYAKAKPYLNYAHVPKANRGVDIPLVLMLLRWDGYIGFPGGHVDEGESLTEAAVRELKEEINLDVHEDDLTPLATFTGDGINIHSFCMDVYEEEIRLMIRNAVDAEHFLSENQGCFAMQVANFERNNGLDQFRRNNFKATALMELDVLIAEKLSES